MELSLENLASLEVDTSPLRQTGDALADASSRLARVQRAQLIRPDGPVGEWAAAERAVTEASTRSAWRQARRTANELRPDAQREWDHLFKNPRRPQPAQSEPVRLGKW